MKKTLVPVLIISAFFAPSTYTIQKQKSFEREIYDQIAQYYVFAKALGNGVGNIVLDFVCLNHELDRNWKKLYKQNNEKIKNLDIATNALYQALEKNPYTDPRTFMLGASSSACQVEGGLDSTSAYARFYSKQGLPTAGKATNFWNEYKKHISEMKNKLGSNAFRLSIAWNRVFPQKNNVDTQALQHYRNIITTLKQKGITKIILVFQHYDVPDWFEDEGGFAKIENNQYFVDFAKEVYTALHEDVTYWSTFNAIEGYAFKGYWTGEGAPGEKSNMQKAARVMANMLESHVQIYRAIKGFDDEKYVEGSPNEPLYLKYKRKNPNIPVPQIGIQKNVMPLDPACKTWQQWLLSPFSRFVCSIGNMLQNEGFYGFFTNGRFRLYIPGIFKHAVFLENKHAPKSLDWIGVNHYSNSYMFLGNRVDETNPHLQTENKNYRFYPEGLSRAVTEIYNRIAVPVGKIKNNDKRPIPIIITENGIATKNDKEGNKKREEFFKETLFTITQMIREEMPIIGYTPWANEDNFEWHSKDKKTDKWIIAGVGKKRYGFFHINFDDENLPRTLKPGAQYFANFVKTFLKKAKTAQVA